MGCRADQSGIVSTGQLCSTSVLSSPSARPPVSVVRSSPLGPVRK